MSNIEARRNAEIRIIRGGQRSRLRHSGVVSNSPFDASLARTIRHSSFRAQGAVTIIEMLVVIMVIFILAALVLAASSYVQNKGARARAESEIAAISAALESYKADNGIYPANNATNSLDPTTTTNPASYVSAANYLYIQLSGDSDGNPTTTSSSDTRNYFGGSLKQNMLGPNPPGANTYLRDPFGNSYGYSTSKNPTANPTGYSTANGYNPTFDLWSTANDSTGNTSKWIKNW